MAQSCYPILLALDIASILNSNFHLGGCFPRQRLWSRTKHLYHFKCYFWSPQQLRDRNWILELGAPKRGKFLIQGVAGSQHCCLLPSNLFFNSALFPRNTLRIFFS